MDETTVHGLAAIAEAWDDDDALEQVHRYRLHGSAGHPEHDWNKAIAAVRANRATADRT
jgi:hypothetical protein